MATPSRCPQRSVRFPPSSSTTAANSGNTSSSHAARCAPTAGKVVSAWATAVVATASEPVTALLLVLQQPRVVHRRGPAGTEDRHQDRQAYHDLGGRDHHHEERDDLAVQVAVHAGEGHEREVDRVEHELDAHENHHCVAPPQDTHRADHEQDHSERHEVPGTHQASPSWPELPPGSPGPAALRIAAVLLPSSVRRWSGVSGTPWMADGTEASSGVPSGSRAGMSTALCRAYVPGPDSGAGWPLDTRSRDRSRWVSLGVRRSRCASTMAPSAAVISRALVTSNGNT